MANTETTVEARAREALELAVSYGVPGAMVTPDPIIALTAAGLRIVDAVEDDRRAAENAALVRVLDYLDEQDFLELPAAIQPIIERYRDAEPGVEAMIDALARCCDMTITGLGEHVRVRVVNHAVSESSLADSIGPDVRSALRTAWEAVQEATGDE